MGATEYKTVIAEDIEITGSINSASDIQLAGKLNGDLTCNGKAVIGETATVKGNITANSTSVNGQVHGNVTVKDRIELASTARLTGDIQSKRLSVEDGATFVGKSEVNPAGISPSRISGSKTEEKIELSETHDKPTGQQETAMKNNTFSRK